MRSAAPQGTAQKIPNKIKASQKSFADSKITVACVAACAMLKTSNEHNTNGAAAMKYLVTETYFNSGRVTASMIPYHGEAFIPQETNETCDIYREIYGSLPAARQAIRNTKI